MIGGKDSGVLSMILYRSLRATVIECAESTELPEVPYLKPNTKFHGEKQKHLKLIIEKRGWRGTGV